MKYIKNLFKGLSELTQTDRLDFLIKNLLDESGKYLNTDLDDKDKPDLFRSLMNIRMPSHIESKVLEIQDDYLKQDLNSKKVTTLSELPNIKEQYNSKHKLSHKLSIWKGDITTLKVDAIVNAANSQLLGCFIPLHKCIDNVIHSAAGMQLREECSQYMKSKRLQDKNYKEPTGTAMITNAYNLPSDYIIHTVGPIVSYDLTKSLKNDLKNSYNKSLEIAVNSGIKNIAFCCISTGEFRFPNNEAAKIAIDTVTEFMNQNPNALDRVIFNVFKDLDKNIYEKLLK